MVDSVVRQLRSAAARAGLSALLGSLTFDPDAVAALEACGEGETAEVHFGNSNGPLGRLLVDLHGTGDPEEGLTVGLRGWVLDDDVASV